LCSIEHGVPLERGKFSSPFLPNSLKLTFRLKWQMVRHR
jgi:hypothetical protein